MTRLFALLALSSSAFAQLPTTDWRFAHPDADLKMSVNLQAVLKSDAIVKAIEQGKAQAKDNAAQIDLVLGILRTIDRFSVSTRQTPGSEMDVLAEVTGSFDPQMIAGFFPSTGKGQVKVVGPHAILIGDGDSFAQAVARMNGGPAAAGGDDIEQSDIWIAGSAEFLARQSGQEIPPMLQGLRTFGIGLTLSAMPEVTVVLGAKDEAGAGQLLSMFQLLSGPMLAASPATADLGKALSMTQDGSRVRMHMVIPPELVAMAQQQAMAAAGGLPAQLAPLLGGMGIGGSPAASKSAAGPKPASSPKPAAVATEPPAQNGGKVKIYGLDDGTKEIPAH